MAGPDRSMVASVYTCPTCGTVLGDCESANGTEMVERRVVETSTSPKQAHEHNWQTVFEAKNDTGRIVMVSFRCDCGAEQTVS